MTPTRRRTCVCDTKTPAHGSAPGRDGAKLARPARGRTGRGHEQGKGLSTRLTRETQSNPQRGSTKPLGTPGDRWACRAAAGRSAGTSTRTGWQDAPRRSWEPGAHPGGTGACATKRENSRLVEPHS